MKKVITTDDVLNDRTLFTEKQSEKIKSDIEKKAQKYWGGARQGAGRKAKPQGEVLQFTKRLTQKEVDFINYARLHHLNYDELMQG